MTAALREEHPQGPMRPPGDTTGLFGVFRRRYLLRLLVRKELRVRYQASLLGPRGLLVEHAVHQPVSHQSSERTPQRVVIGRVAVDDADLGEPRGAVRQQGLNGAVTLLLMLAQNQTGEELRLGEPIVATERAGIFRQQRQRELVGLNQNGAGRLAGFDELASSADQFVFLGTGGKCSASVIAV